MKSRILLLILTLLTTFFAKAQNISGIINSYAAVANINLNVLTVNSTAGFNVGDKVLIIKMKGATINQANSPAYGDTTALGEAGKYTFSTIIALTPTTMTLSPFCNIFANAQYVQVVSVPIFPNPTVIAPLTCQAWDGSTGGVLIFETPGTLTLNDNIDISHQGYRGGDLWGNGLFCGPSNFATPQVFFGPEGKKGEGVADYILGEECGKGKLANGGGGAFGGHGGGAGGANAGAGGSGGFEQSTCPIIGAFAYGGQPINHVNTSLIMGGGGGGPQADSNQQIYNGGNGGGIVYIVANEIVGNGFTIHNNGQTTPNINDEAASGGGAGGSTYLLCPTFTGPLTLSVIGGSGGSNNNILEPTYCQGPGGGGGGGLVWFSGGSTPPNVNIARQGGNGGFVLNILSTCFGSQYNAGDGDSGIVKYNFTPTPPPVLPTLNLGPDQISCGGIPIILDAGPGYASYLWDDASIGQTRNVTGPGTYFATITTPQGCTASDTVLVFSDTNIVANFDVSLRLGCDFDTVIITNTSSAACTQFAWDFGDGNQSSASGPILVHAYSNQGSYNITLIASNPPCADTIVKSVNFNHPINASFFTTNGDSLCIPKNYLVTSTSTPNPLFFQHDWNWGDGSPNSVGTAASHFYTQPGDYKMILTVTDTLGCTDTASTIIHVEPMPYVDFILSSDNICVGETVVFNDSIASNCTNFFWDFGDGQTSTNEHNPYHIYDFSGQYNIILKGLFEFCKDSMEVTKLLTVNDYPSVNLGPDTSLCPGLTGSILLNNVINSAAIYTWSTGEVGNSITVTEPGHYWIQATTPGSNCSTYDSIWVKRDCYISIPNVFSPDGNGSNDYFLPRELLGAGLIKFKMSIYNRWGENLFNTEAIDGRGWDGKYNGKPQPMGTYVYVIEVQFENNMRKTFKGNFTLVR